MSLVDYADDEDSQEEQISEKVVPTSSKLSKNSKTLIEENHSSTTDKGSAGSPSSSPVINLDKKVTTFTVPIRAPSFPKGNNAYFDNSLDEDFDEEIPKRRKEFPNSRGILSFLPPPKNHSNLKYPISSTNIGSGALDLFDSSVPLKKTFNAEKMPETIITTLGNSCEYEKLKSSNSSVASAGVQDIRFSTVLPPPSFEDDEDESSNFENDKTRCFEKDTKIEKCPPNIKKEELATDVVVDEPFKEKAKSDCGSSMNSASLVSRPSSKLPLGIQELSELRKYKKPQEALPRQPNRQRVPLSFRSRMPIPEVLSNESLDANGDNQNNAEYPNDKIINTCGNSVRNEIGVDTSFGFEQQTMKLPAENETQTQSDNNSQSFYWQQQLESQDQNVIGFQQQAYGYYTSNEALPMADMPSLKSNSSLSSLGKWKNIPKEFRELLIANSNSSICNPIDDNNALQETGVGINNIDPSKLSEIPHFRAQSDTTSQKITPSFSSSLFYSSINNNNNNESVSGDWHPTRNHRRQNHATFLVWDIQRKASELEMKRAESLKTKRETRSKYGW